MLCKDTQKVDGTGILGPSIHIMDLALRAFIVVHVHELTLQSLILMQKNKID